MSAESCSEVRSIEHRGHGVKTVHVAPFFRVSKPLRNRRSRDFNLRYKMLIVEGLHSALGLECTSVLRDSTVHVESPVGTNREGHERLAGRRIIGGMRTTAQDLQARLRRDSRESSLHGQRS
jgi:hypothetical protein